MAGVRVTGGSLRGRRIQLPRGVEVRPTSDRARQAYFNIVRERLAGGRFLDLFSGTGIFSVEALSRGAAYALALDESRRGVMAIEELARQLGIDLEARAAKLPQALATLASGEPFDLVYADPPYDAELGLATLAAIDAGLPLAEGAVVAIEHRAGPSMLEGAALTRLRFRRVARYGNVAIAIFDLSDA